MKIIHAYIKDVKNSIFKDLRKDKASCTTISCNNSENCELYKNNLCVKLKNLNTYCPYGTMRIEYGFTIKAKQYYNWINEKKEQYKNIPKLGQPVTKMALIGDYVYLPYSFMAMNEYVPFIEREHIFSSGKPYIKKEDFNFDNIINIITFHPRALNGEVISRYQKEVVPLFISHLYELFPDIFAEVAKRSIIVAKYNNNINYVGRKAILQTLKINTGYFIDIHGGYWSWDGEYLTSTNSKVSFHLVDKHIEVKIKPSENSIVKITDNNQYIANKTVLVN